MHMHAQTLKGGHPRARTDTPKKALTHTRTLCFYAEAGLHVILMPSFSDRPADLYPPPLHS